VRAKAALNVGRGGNAKRFCNEKGRLWGKGGEARKRAYCLPAIGKDIKGGEKKYKVNLPLNVGNGADCLGPGGRAEMGG